MFKCEFETGQTIVAEGDIGQSIFIIKSGTVRCCKGNSEIRQLGFKDYFGESSILFDSNRSMSIIANERTICYQISRSALVENLGVDYKKVILNSIAKEAFRNSKYMKTFANENYYNIVSGNREIKVFEDKEKIPFGGGRDNRKLFYVLLSGNFVSEKVVVANRGELYGDIYIKAKTSQSDVYAQGECQVLEYDWELIVPNIKVNIEKRKILSLFNRINNLKKIQIFHHTSEGRLIEIGKIMKKEKFEPGSVVFKEGDMGNTLYLIKKGKVKVYKSEKFIREICENNCFGEISLLISEPRTATVIAETNVTTYTLTKDNFNSFIDKHMLDYLARKLQFQDTFHQTLDDLYFIKALGKGKFGNVSLVHNHKYLYAIKAVSRESAERQKILTRYLSQERTVLLKLDHPFIMKLVNTFKNDEYVFFLLEYINGKCLNKFLSANNARCYNNVNAIKFYMSILLLILNYLNSKKICHRDLKPENIVLDEKGYLKLIDFGTSKELTDFTNTITGTPHYIAPEVLLGKGYGFSCDYWSIGVIGHLIFYSAFPFGRNAKDPIDIYREVMKKELILPKGDTHVNHLISSLLKKKVTERICSLEKAKMLNLFVDYKWNEVVDMSMKAPFIPVTEMINNVKDYNVKYIQYANKMYIDNRDRDTLLSSYEDENEENYNSKWVDSF